MKKSTIRFRFAAAALLLASHWLTAISAIRKGTIFAYQNYFGAPQEKYTLVLILILATAVYFILLWRHLYPVTDANVAKSESPTARKSFSQRLYEARTARELRQKADEKSAESAVAERKKPIRHMLKLPK